LLLVNCETKIRLDEKTREEVIRTLADLLLEAIDGLPGEAMEGANESQD
jgi:hypothetical protein